jgi:hypothetical protein
MAKYLSLCEFISKMGGIRLHRADGSRGDGCGELRGMDADKWHKAVPFRAKLIHDDAGRYLDAMGQIVGEAGYFGRGGRPDCHDLLDAIDAELSGHPIYTPEDETAMLQAEITLHAAAQAATQRETTMRLLAASTATAKGRVIPPNSTAVEGLFGVIVYLYAVPYVTKKGRAGESLYAKAFRPGETKPAFHNVFATASERDHKVNEFLQGELV